MPIRCFFYLQLNLKSNFDTSNWDLSNLVDGGLMFRSLQLNEKSNFDTSNWDLSNLVNGDEMFSGLQLNLKSNFDTSNWDLSNLTSAVSMFAESNIEELNFKSWNNANKLNNTYSMLTGSNLTKLTAYCVVLKKLTNNATTYNVNDTILYKCTGRVGTNGLFTIESEPEEA